MPTYKPAATSPDDPSVLAKRVTQLRTEFATAGAAVIPQAQELGEHVLYLDHGAVRKGDVRLADAYSRLGADLGQWLALVYLKIGRGDAADTWGKRAALMARSVGDSDLAAVALCRRAGALKIAEPNRAFELLGNARMLPNLGPWAAAMVAQHQAAVMVKYGADWIPSALGKLDLAEMHLNQAIKDQGAARRPWWAGSAERPLSITHTGIDYRRAETMLYQHPESATGLLDQVHASLDDQATVSRAGVNVRRASVARVLGRPDDSATLALEAWNVLEPAGIQRDMARVRQLAHTLGRESDAQAVRQLGEAVATA